ncbi:MAG: TfoX/Sxy family transcriptional regulator of competence genes [Cryomorphaceae bacterium]|jgi:TfoX/Sxy family transcriptional regulator of competence genes
MSSNQNYVDYILDHIEDSGEILAKKMFGEYGIYSDGKIFGSICDNRLFIKPTKAGRAFIGEPTEAPPYPGAKPNFLIEEKIEDKEWLSQLIRVTVEELPAPTKEEEKVLKSIRILFIILDRLSRSFSVLGINT